jgi:hypothetical protein
MEMESAAKDGMEVQFRAARTLIFRFRQAKHAAVV